jgi:hypothetical protein
MARKAEGAQIHRSSDLKTSSPRLERNGSTPIGDTRITRHGRKKRSFENGLRNATPSPPVVIASRSPWEAMLRKTNPKVKSGVAPNLLANGRQVSATTVAKKSECVKPRCPKGCP